MSRGSTVGRFVLDEWIGEGAAGRVWRCEDVATGRVIALKLLGQTRVENDREVLRAVALDHTHIVGLLDRGRVTPAEALASEGGLIAGTPWIAFEYVAGESLSSALRRGRVTRWREVLGTLQRVLQALAHAHARGVVHLDVKPGNILLGHGGFREARLTDFGVALAYQSDTAERICGTPPFMAPEQFSGDTAAIGPWTDLYAVGCLAFALCTGSSPVEDTTTVACATSHQAGHYRPFRPRFPVPVDLAPWLDTLLLPSANRPRSAAQVASALGQLGPALWMASEQSTAPDAEVETATLGVLEPIAAPTRLTRLPVRRRFVPPPLGRRWPADRRVAARTVDDAQHLSVAALRAIPLVGRGHAQTVLWQALHHLRGGASSRLWVHGPEGVGRTALVCWFTQAAAEVGACPTLEVDPSSDSPLAGAVRSRLGLGDLAGLEVRALAMGMPRSWIETTQRMLEHSEPDLASWLGMTLADTPHIVVMPDCAEALELAGASEPAVWVVVSSRPDHARGFDAIPVAPLSPIELNLVLRHLLPLDPPSEDVLIEESGSRPGTLVDRVRRHVADGDFLATPRGFSLQAEPYPAPPALAVPTALPLSVFGGPIPLQVAVALVPEHMDALLASGVLWSDGDSVVFTRMGTAAATRVLSENLHLVRRAAATACLAMPVKGIRATGTNPVVLAARQLQLVGDGPGTLAACLPALHATCGSRSPREWEVLAVRAHAAAPSRWTAACVAIEQAAVDRSEGRIAGAEEALLHVRGALPDSLRLRWSVEWARVCAMRGDLSGALEAIDTEAVAPDPGVTAYSVQMKANILNWLGQRDGAAALMEQAYCLNTELARWVSAGFCALRLIRLCPAADRRRWEALALEHFTVADHAMGVGEVESYRGHVARTEGRLDRALQHYRAFLEVARAHGRGDAIFAELNAGVVLLAQKRWSEAIDLFDQAHGEALAQGLTDALIPALLGRVTGLANLAERDDFEPDLVEVLGHLEGLESPEKDVVLLVQQLLESTESRGWEGAAARTRSTLSQWESLPKSS